MLMYVWWVLYCWFIIEGLCCIDLDCEDFFVGLFDVSVVL